jgi:hypothetical protein
MPPINPTQQTSGNPLDEINAKLDAIMQHIGCDYKSPGMDKDAYMNMPDDEKDKIDAKQVLGNV